MKERIKTDSAILSSVIILTAFVFGFYKWYPSSPLVDNLLNFLGMLTLLKGTYIRMGARGYKKKYSGKGTELVMDGPYSFVRNPMYLGTLLMGSGFILILWPWWSLPIFVGLFYLRFNRQMVKEEAHLGKSFGKDYQAYMKRTPRLFPDLGKLRKMKLNQVFPWELAWTTKEKYALFIWPGVAIVLELMQQRFFGARADVSETISIFALAVITFSFCLWWEYSRAA